MGGDEEDFVVSVDLAITARARTEFKRGFVETGRLGGAICVPFVPQDGWNLWDEWDRCGARAVRLLTSSRLGPCERDAAARTG